jgi:phage FluMu gp28-like protein
MAKQNNDIQNAPEFLSYQAKWLCDTGRMKIFEKARQIGISHVSAYSAVVRASHPSATLDVWVSSRDEIQANQFLADSVHFAENCLPEDAARTIP